MNITFVISNLGSGGAERVLCDLANNFVSNGSIVSIVVLGNGSCFYELDERINIIEYKDGTVKGIIQWYKYIRFIRRSIKKTDSNIVISFMNTVNIFTTVACFFNKSKLILTEHNNHLKLSLANKFATKLLYRFSDYVTVLTKFDFDYFSGFCNAKILPNPTTFKPRKIDFTSKEKIIFSAGSLIEQKGFDRLLQAFKRVNKEHSDWKLWIAGDGPLKGELLNYIESNNLSEQVKLLGRVKNIEDYYSRASIFALTSRWEGLGMVLIEAMSFGCSVISTNCNAGPSDIISHGINGYLIDDWDLESYSTALSTLMDDTILRETLACNGVNSIDKYQVELISEEWNILLKGDKY